MEKKTKPVCFETDEKKGFQLNRITRKTYLLGMHMDTQNGQADQHSQSSPFYYLGFVFG